MSYESLVIGKVKKRIAEEIARSHDTLMIGQGIEDFPTYRYAVGYVKALHDSITIIDEVMVDVAKGEDDAKV